MACIHRYYAAWGGTNPGVGVAYSEFPSGPFRDVLGGPVMPGNDPTIFIDPDDPSVRVLCSNVRPDQSLGNYGPLCGTLANDMVTWEQQPAIMAGFNKTTWRFFEAPWLHKMDDKYYLSFMMEGTDIGYAWSDAPMGPYSKIGPVQWSPPYDNDPPFTASTSNNTQGWANNHQGIVEFPEDSGQYFLAYHNQKLRQDRNVTTRARNVALDRMHVNATDGSILLVASTPSWMAPLGYLDPYVQTPSFVLAACSPGVDTHHCADTSTTEGAQPLSLSGLTHKSYTIVRYVDFGSSGSVESVALRAASPFATAITIQTGTEPTRKWTDAAKCLLAPTKAFDQWKTAECRLSDGNLSALSGVVEELRFVYTCEDDKCRDSKDNSTSILDFVWWRFDRASSSNVNRRERPPPAQRAVVVDVALSSRGADGQYLACREEQRLLKADGAANSRATRVQLVDNDDGSWTLRCGGNSTSGSALVACADQSVDVKLIAEKDRPPPCAKWTLQGTTDSSYGFRSWSTMGWLAASPSGELSATASDYIHPKANRYVLDSEARFDVEELARKRTNAPSNAPTAPPSAAASLGSWPSGVAALLVRALAWAAGAPLN